MLDCHLGIKREYVATLTLCGVQWCPNDFRPTNLYFLTILSFPHLHFLRGAYEGGILPLISSTHPIPATGYSRLIRNIRSFKFILWNALVQTHTQPRVLVYFSVSCLLCTLPISFPINVVVKRIASAILSFNQEREFKKTRMFVNTATHPHNPTNRRRCNALI